MRRSRPNTASRIAAVALCVAPAPIAGAAAAQTFPGAAPSPIVAATRIAPGTMDAAQAAAAVRPHLVVQRARSLHLVPAGIRPLPPLAGAASAIRFGIRPGAPPPPRSLRADIVAPGRDYRPIPSHTPPDRRLSSGQISVAGARPDRVFRAEPPIDPVLTARQLAGDPVPVNRGARIGARLGASTVRLATGTRLGGGADYPSPEAVSYDPRDLLDYRAKAIETPAVRQQP